MFLKKTGLRLFQAGVHVPLGTAYSAAQMRAWPKQSIPENFRFTEEQRFKVKSIPRDVGKIPRDFVLSVLFRHQPCEVASLWTHCVSDPQIVLDSKKHLRDVLEQARAEGFISFEKDAVSHRWVCHLTRERFEDVRAIVAAKAEATEQYSSLRGAASTDTADFSGVFQQMNEEAKKEHLRILQEQVAETTEHLKKFQRTEIDYLPYTDLNGKVNFMWWYETVESKDMDTLPSGSDATKLTEE